MRQTDERGRAGKGGAGGTQRLKATFGVLGGAGGIREKGIGSVSLRLCGGTSSGASNATVAKGGHIPGGSPLAARTRAHRARQKLQEELGDLSDIETRRRKS
jgi:hypothetical protein